jgi:hypothetical protein
MFLESKTRRVRRAYNLTTIWDDCLDNMWSLTFHNLIGLNGLYGDSFTFYFYTVKT